MSLPDFDSTKYCLGLLCKRGHDWEGTKQSLRYKRTKKTGTCVECSKMNSKLPHVMEAARRRARKHARNNSERKQQYMKRWREANKEKIREYDKQRRQGESFLAKRRISDSRWRKTEKGQQCIRRMNQERRISATKNHSMNTSHEEIQSRIKDFGGCCAYCAKALNIDKKRGWSLDHFIPLSRGGANVLGNLVPCCLQCNSSKHDHDPVAWFQSKKFPESRFKKILKILGKTEATLYQIPLF